MKFVTYMGRKLLSIAQMTNHPRECIDFSNIKYTIPKGDKFVATSIKNGANVNRIKNYDTEKINQVTKDDDDNDDNKTEISLTNSDRDYFINYDDHNPLRDCHRTLENLFKIGIHHLVST